MLSTIVFLRFSNSEFQTGSMKEMNPIFNTVMVDGFIVPISSLPKEYQEIARAAKARGEDIQFRTQE